ncbi:MAG: O-antigen ligase family protein, partial [Chloroflexota bacterium]|nr:O-antigen ligase family protein [Chloroflexota bacterium]
TSGTGAARLLIWRASVQAFLARPLLGYGPDGLAPAFERYYPASLLRFEGGWVQFDRAHNEFLDMGLVGGVPAILLYLIIIGWILVLGIRAARGRQSDHARLAAALAGGVAAYIVSNQFGFGTVGTMTQVWLFMALLLGVSRMNDPNSTSVAKTSVQFLRTSGGSGNHGFKSSNGRSSKRGRPGRAAFPTAAGVLGVAGAIAGAVSLVPAMRADAAFQQAWDRTESGDTRGLDGLTAAIELAPGDAHYYEGMAYALINLARAGRQPAEAAGAKAVQLLSSAIDLEPRNAPLYVQRGSAEAGLAELGEPGRLQAAESDFQRAVDLAPRRAVYYEQWGQARLVNGEASEATPLFEKAIALGLADSQLYQEYGQALQQSGWPVKAQRALANAQELKAKEIRDATSPASSNKPIL